MCIQTCQIIKKINCIINVAQIRLQLICICILDGALSVLGLLFLHSFSVATVCSELNASVMLTTYCAVYTKYCI